ncbi:MAG: hypothetical protein ACK56O_13735 [Dolichospermum sp.]
MTREQVTGNRLQGTGKRFWATLLFVTYVGFFPFTYLTLLPLICIIIVGKMPAPQDMAR